MKTAVRLAMIAFCLLLVHAAPIHSQKKPAVKRVDFGKDVEVSRGLWFAEAGGDLYAATGSYYKQVWRLHEGKPERVKTADGRELFQADRGELLPVDGRVVMQGSVINKKEDKRETALYVIDGGVAKPLKDENGKTASIENGVRNIGQGWNGSVNQKFMLAPGVVLRLDGDKVTSFKFPEGYSLPRPLNNSPLLATSRYDDSGRKAFTSWMIINNGKFEQLKDAAGKKLEIEMEDSNSTWTAGNYFFLNVGEAESKWPGHRGSSLACFHVEGSTAKRVEMPEHSALSGWFDAGERVYAIVDQPQRSRLLELQADKAIESDACKRPGKFGQLFALSARALSETTQDLAVVWIVKDGALVPVEPHEGWELDELAEVQRYGNHWLIATRPRAELRGRPSDKPCRMLMLGASGKAAPIRNDKGELFEAGTVRFYPAGDGAYIYTRADNYSDFEFHYVPWND